MSIDSEKYFKKIKELFSLYERVKLCIIYAENFDPKDELYIAPINQLRSSLDHFFKAAAYPSDMDYELKEAQEHLDRAGYDAFEIMASNLGNILIDKLDKYSTSTLTKVFPEYYSIIKPKLIEIRAKIAEIRKRKKNSETGIDYAFSSYFDEVLKLLEFNKQADYHIPSLEEYIYKMKKEQRGNRRERIFQGIIIGIISAIIGGLVVYFITNFNNKVKEPTKKEIFNEKS